MRRRPQEPLHVTGKLCICQRSSIRELPWATTKTRGKATRPSHNVAAHRKDCPHSRLALTTWLTMREVRVLLAQRAGRNRRPIPRQHLTIA